MNIETHSKTHYNQTVERQRQKENFESNKREATHQLQGILNKIIIRLLTVNFEDQRVWDDIFKVLKERLSIENTRYSILSFKSREKLRHS